MELLDMVRDYQELLGLKDELAEKTKENNKKIEELKQVIAQQMVDDDCPKISCGGYVYSLQDKTIWSKKSEADLQKAGLDFFEVLREQGLGDIIKETVSPQTLNSTIRNLVEEQGQLPEELAEVVNSYDTLDIARRKETNRAAKKARGET